MPKTLRVIKIGSHSKGVIIPKSMNVQINDKVPYNTKNGNLTLDINKSLAHKEAKFVKKAFADMRPVSNQEMAHRFPGWGE